MVTCSMTSRDYKRSRSCPRYVWMQISWKPLEIESRFRWTTNSKWPSVRLLRQMIDHNVIFYSLVSSSRLISMIFYQDVGCRKVRRTLKVTQGHLQWLYSIDRIQLFLYHICGVSIVCRSETLSLVYVSVNDLRCHVISNTAVYVQCEPKKESPLRFSGIFPKQLEIFSPRFTLLLYVAIYARLQIFISLIFNFY